MRYPHLNFFYSYASPKNDCPYTRVFLFCAATPPPPLILPHSTLDFLFSHICVTRYGNTSRLIFKFCFTSRNIMLFLYVRRLIHSSLFSSHKSHFCFLLFQTRHFFIFNILLHVTSTFGKLKCRVWRVFCFSMSVRLTPWQRWWIARSSRW